MGPLTKKNRKFGIKWIAKSQITTDDLKQQSFRLQVVVLKKIYSFHFILYLPQRE